jgi:hypothetical protein
MALKTVARRHFKSLPRAKDDLARQRVLGAVEALDRVMDVLPEEPVRANGHDAAPALSLHRAASEKLAEAVEKTAFDEDTGEIRGPTMAPAEQPEETPPPAARAKGKRRTPAERLAEADAAKAGNGAAPGAKSAGATSGNAGARPPETRPNEHLEEDFAAHKAAQFDDDTFPGDLPSAQQPAEHDDTPDPRVDAYAAGWIARSKGRVKTAFPQEIVGNKELMAFFGQGWDAYDGHSRAGTAPTTAQQSEEMLDAAIDVVFGQ